MQCRQAGQAGGAGGALAGLWLGAVRLCQLWCLLRLSVRALPLAANCCSLFLFLLLPRLNCSLSALLPSMPAACLPARACICVDGVCQPGATRHHQGWVGGIGVGARGMAKGGRHLTGRLQAPGAKLAGLAQAQSGCTYPCRAACTSHLPPHLHHPTLTSRPAGCDSFVEGQGHCSWYMWGAVPTASGGGREVEQSLRVRWLAGGLTDGRMVCGAVGPAAASQPAPNCAPSHLPKSHTDYTCLRDHLWYYCRGGLLPTSARAQQLLAVGRSDWRPPW